MFGNQRSFGQHGPSVMVFNPKDLNPSQDLFSRFDEAHTRNHSVYRLKLSEYCGETPGSNNEVFCTGFPYNYTDQQILTEFLRNGQVYEVRIPRDRGGSYNQKGFAFAKYLSGRDACSAVVKMSGRELFPGRSLRASLAWADRMTSFLVGNIPRSKSYEVLWMEFNRRTVGLQELIIFPDALEPQRYPNQGVCRLTYDFNCNAAVASYKIANDNYPFWGRQLTVQRGSENELISMVSNPPDVGAWPVDNPGVSCATRQVVRSGHSRPSVVEPQLPKAQTSGRVSYKQYEDSAPAASPAGVFKAKVVETVRQAKPTLPPIVYPSEEDLATFGLEYLFGELNAM